MAAWQTRLGFDTWGLDCILLNSRQEKSPHRQSLCYSRSRLRQESMLPWPARREGGQGERTEGEDEGDEGEEGGW